MHKKWIGNLTAVNLTKNKKLKKKKEFFFTLKQVTFFHFMKYGLESTTFILLQKVR